MNGIIMRVLRKLHILAATFDRDDVINAETEDKVRDTSALTDQVSGTLHRREELNGRLRESIRIARESTTSFGDFETLTIRRNRRRNV